MVRILKTHKKVEKDQIVHETNLHERDEKVFWIKEFKQRDGTLMYYWNYRVVRTGVCKRLKITLLKHLSTSEMPHVMIFIR